MLVRRCCRTPRSVPRMMSLLLSASFTLVPPSKIVWRWAPFERSRRGRPPRPTWNRFERLFCLSLRLRVRVGQAFVLRTSAMRCAQPPLTCFSGFSLRWSASCFGVKFQSRSGHTFAGPPSWHFASRTGLCGRSQLVRPSARLTSKVAVDLITTSP